MVMWSSYTSPESEVYQPSMRFRYKIAGVTVGWLVSSARRLEAAEWRKRP
jgi:hypothetical protein